MQSIYYNRLETPPPSSSFRRPWSPDPAEPLPSGSTRELRPVSPGDYFSYPHGYLKEHASNREPSDPSVEALDLADYANTLRRIYEPQRHQPVPFRAYDPYPPSPNTTRPLASMNSLTLPSLTSDAGTATSRSHQVSRPHHRPFSLPARSRERISFADVYANSTHAHDSAEAQDEREIDIAQFPPWSRAWYAPAKPSPASKSSRSILPSTSPNQPTSPSYFDPAYPIGSNVGQSGPPFPHPGASLSSQPNSALDGSQRGLLPWGAEPPGYAPPIDEEIKQERVRMLEREFGGAGKEKGYHKHHSDEREHMIGSVDEKGRLITVGQKKRVAVRAVQIMLALCAAITSIYAAVMIKPAKAPPPRGTPQTYILYVLSVLSTLVMLYLFLVRPCCFGRRSPKNSHHGVQGPGGMMALPVQHLPAVGKGGKKKGRKGEHEGMPGDVQVNLIVDPGMFGGGHDSPPSSGASDEDAWGTSQYGSSTGYGRRHGGRRRAPRRRSVFAGLAMEEQWRSARASLKRVLLFDVGALVAWAAEFMYIVVGKRCPANGYDGWCDAYNVASASTCLLALCYGFSIFFDIKDLHASRVSPRTRI